MKLLWGWNWEEFLGMLMVFIGVAGTWIAMLFRYKKFSHDDNDLMPIEFWKTKWEAGRATFEKKKRRFDVGCEGVLVIGLAFEIIGFSNQFSTDVALNGRVEELRQKNDALEYQNSPRLYLDQPGSAERLKKYAGTKVVVKAEDVKEYIQTAKQISFTLDLAHWDRQHPTIVSKQRVFSGAKVMLNEGDEYMKPHPDWQAWMQKEREFEAERSATIELVRELNKTGIGATLAAPEPSFPVGVIIIEVGQKPSIDEALEMKLQAEASDEKLSPEERHKAWVEMWQVESNMTKASEKKFKGTSGANEAD